MYSLVERFVTRVVFNCLHAQFNRSDVFIIITETILGTYCSCKLHLTMMFALRVRQIVRRTKRPTVRLTVASVKKTESGYLRLLSSCSTYKCAKPTSRSLTPQ